MTFTYPGGFQWNTAEARINQSRNWLLFSLVVISLGILIVLIIITIGIYRKWGEMSNINFSQKPSQRQNRSVDKLDRRSVLRQEEILDDEEIDLRNRTR